MRWAILLGVALLLPVAGAGGASHSARSVSPLVGVWTKDGTPVLRVGWEPTTAQLYGDVVSDFRFSPNGCLHREGERLFEVGATNPWPNGFAGTGVVLDGDTRTTGHCGSVGSRVTLSVGPLPSGPSARYGVDICFHRASGGMTCSSALTRAAAPWEAVSTCESGQYVAPGIWRAAKGTGVAFVVDAGGSIADPNGRWIRGLSASPTRAVCAAWSVSAKRWVGAGTPSAMTVTFDGPIALGASTSVRGTWQTATRNTIDRIELSASFADWAHLRGSIRAVHYTYSGRRPADPDRPGRAAAIRCDSGTTTFASELVPGSWPEVAESHGG